MVRLEQVRKYYGEHAALSPIDLSIPDGQTIGLLGPNGAGKSTLMNIVTGCLAPSGGNVFIGPFDLMKDPRRAKRLIGYLPETNPLYDEMTVRDYLAFICRLREVEKRSVSSHISEIAEMVCIGDIMGRRVGNLSKGYRQRVGLAQSLCGDPQVLILDEPTSGLDPIQSAEFRKIISSFSGEKTILFSSHLLSEVQSLCSRVVILNHGNLISDTNLQDKARQRKLRATIDMEKNALVSALASLDAFEQVQPVQDGENGLTTVILTCKNDSSAPEKDLFTLLSGLKAPLIRLMPVEDSVEDIFFKVTESNQRKNGRVS
ncbi:MAG: ATP-binding cassette domain-containing protein [Clostridia bacterium]|nr:ATP-binding cassette domain-containing protein [Clostridia bacterium]